MTRQDVFEVIIRSIEEIVPDISIENINMEDSLKEIGVNSVDRMDIIVTTLEELELHMQMVQFGGLKNIGEIVDVILKEYRGE
jgi:polyketide biosynthesis acyl carrier protein